MTFKSGSPLVMCNQNFAVCFNLLLFPFTIFFWLLGLIEVKPNNCIKNKSSFFNYSGTPTHLTDPPNPYFWIPHQFKLIGFYWWTLFSKSSFFMARLFTNGKQLAITNCPSTQILRNFWKPQSLTQPRFCKPGSLCPGIEVFIYFRAQNEVKSLCSRGQEWKREGCHSHKLFDI